MKLRSRGSLHLKVEHNRWHLAQQSPLYLNLIREEGFLRAFPTDTGGGVAGGDSQHIVIHLKASRLLWQPASATVCYPNRRGDSQPTRLTTSLQVDEESTLLCLNKPLIPCCGSRIIQETCIDVAPGGRLLFMEPYTSGRVAYGQKWAFDTLSGKLTLSLAGVPALKEHWELSPGSIPSGAAGFAGCSHWGSLFAVGKNMDTLLHKMLILMQDKGVRGAYSEIREGVLAARILDGTGKAMNRPFHKLCAEYFTSL